LQNEKAEKAMISAQKTMVPITRRVVERSLKPSVRKKTPPPAIDEVQ
jgi:hypothetical protein